MNTAEKDWSKYVEKFDKLQEHIVGNEVMVMLKDEYSKLSDLGNLLELGCGNGTYTLLIEHAADKITATDCSAGMVKAAEKKLEGKEKIKIQQANCYGLQFADASYDSVMMANVIHVVADPVKAIKETHRVMKPSGTLVITSFTADGMSFFNKLALIFKYLATVGKPPASGTPFGLQSLAEFVKGNGFEVLESKLIGKTSKAIFIVAKKK